MTGIKRMTVFCLIAAFALCVTLLPAFAAKGSKTDPVEIIDTSSPEYSGETSEPTKSTNFFEDLFEKWGLAGPDASLTVFNGTTGAGWSLVNLILATLTTVFGLVAVGKAGGIAKNKAEYKYNGEKYILLSKTKKGDGQSAPETEFIRKSPLWKGGFFDVITAIGAVIAFLLTQNMNDKMALFDKWSPAMAALFGVCIILYALTAKGTKVAKELAAKIMASKK